MTLAPIIFLAIGALAVEAIAYSLALYWPKLVANAIELEALDDPS